MARLKLQIIALHEYLITASIRVKSNVEAAVPETTLPVKSIQQHPCEERTRLKNLHSEESPGDQPL